MLLHDNKICILFDLQDGSEMVCHGVDTMNTETRKVMIKKSRVNGFILRVANLYTPDGNCRLYDLFQR